MSDLVEHVLVKKIGTIIKIYNDLRARVDGGDHAGDGGGGEAEQPPFGEQDDPLAALEDHVVHVRADPLPRHVVRPQRLDLRSKCCCYTGLGRRVIPRLRDTQSLKIVWISCVNSPRSQERM